MRAPFVTWTPALLWSLFPTATATDLIHTIRLNVSGHRHRSIIPALLNVEAAYQLLQSTIKNSTVKRNNDKVKSIWGLLEGIFCKLVPFKLLAQFTTIIPSNFLKFLSLYLESMCVEPKIGIMNKIG